MSEKPELEQSRDGRFFYDTIDTDRSFDDYQVNLGFEPDEFAGKKVLDLGSGEMQKFAREAGKLDIEVISLSPKSARQLYRDQAVWANLESLFEPSVPLIAGIAQELPFKDQAFDVVVSNWAVPWYIPRDQKAYNLAFQEMSRVLKPGGQAFLYPVSEDRKKLARVALGTVAGVSFGLERPSNQYRQYDRLIITKNK